MTDRELLELAAKAAGYRGKWDNQWWAMCAGENYWDPLRSKVQAFKLGVKVKLPGAFDEAWVISNTSIQEYERDPESATQRAIVRAAAEIGKAMP